MANTHPGWDCAAISLICNAMNALSLTIDRYSTISSPVFFAGIKQPTARIWLRQDEILEPLIVIFAAVVA
jgi:hypothetical protein